MRFWQIPPEILVAWVDLKHAPIHFARRRRTILALCKRSDGNWWHHRIQGSAQVMPVAVASDTLEIHFIVQKYRTQKVLHCACVYYQPFYQIWNIPSSAWGIHITKNSTCRGVICEWQCGRGPFMAGGRCPGIASFCPLPCSCCLSQCWSPPIRPRISSASSTPHQRKDWKSTEKLLEIWLKFTFVKTLR